MAATATLPVTPVGILAATLERAVRRLDGLPATDPELAADVRAAHLLAAGLEPYLERCTTPESPALRELADRTLARDWPGRTGEGAVVALTREMLSGHVEGQLLKMLVRLTGARRVLEIGMFTGYSALAMAEALPAGGVVVACELDPDVAAFAAAGFRASPHGAKIDVRVGPAAATLAELAAGEPFDLVFLDADKPGYAGYLAALLDTGLLPAHGLLCVDNTLLQGEPWLPGSQGEPGAAIARFNEAVVADPRVEQVLLPLRDGLTLIRRIDAAEGGTTR